MTGSYSRMRFNSPLNGYLYAFRIGVQKYFLSYFLCSHIDNTIPFNVYFYISNEAALNVNDYEIFYKPATKVTTEFSDSFQFLMLDEDPS
jgi:hypothetical protein